MGFTLFPMTQCGTKIIFAVLVVLTSYVNIHKIVNVS